MNFPQKNRRLIIILIATFILALLGDIISHGELKYRLKTGYVERKLQDVEKEGMECLENIATTDTVGTTLINTGISDNEIYSLFVYKDGKLKAWTNNSFSLPAGYDSTLFAGKVLQLDNHWLIINKITDGSSIYLCLLDVYKGYRLQNKYLESGFNPALGLDRNTRISDNRDSGYPVYSEEGEYLFSLVYDKEGSFSSFITSVPVILWISFVIIFLMLIHRIAGWLVKRGFSFLGFITSLQAVVIIYLVFLLLDKPSAVTGMEIFSPYRLNLGTMIPSAGHLLFLSALFLFICIEFYRYFPDLNCRSDNSRRNNIIISLFLVLAALIFFLFSRTLHILILESNISFQFVRILDTDIFAVISFSALTMILAGFSIFTLRVAGVCRNYDLRAILLSLVFSVILLIVLFYFFGRLSVIHILTYLALLTHAWLYRSGKRRLINITVTFALLAAAYSSYVIPKYTWEKETEKLEVIAVNYSTQNDIYGESLLLDIWTELQRDTLLQEVLERDYLSADEVNSVYSYLDRKYFNDYWDNYEKIYTICEDTSPLYFESDTGRIENCFEFFRSRISEMGIPVKDSNLVFLDNRSGRPYYLGCLYFEKPGGGRNGLFIELVNVVRYQQSGYPELLIDARYDKQAVTDDYPVARYYNDSLVLQTGDHPFDNQLSFELSDSLTYQSFPRNRDIEYFTYNDGNVTIVVAREYNDFADILVTFNYLFIVFFILYLLMMLIVRPPGNITPGRMNFTQKLQIAFLSLLIGSLVAIGTVVVILSIGQYREKHYENIEEKLGSVYIELDHKLSEVDSLDLSWSADNYPDLDALLVKFSNVFKTDINLYDESGQLIATSRREIFEKDLKSERMDFRAYKSLRYHGESQFIHQEKVGSMEYLSAYTPFVNNENVFLAYLNLPYFNMQSRISEETSNLIAAMINFSMILLVVSLSIAVFISVRITNPLRMLQQGLASVRLEEKSQPLEYGGHDEIAELVNQYNMMLDELQESALKLARSEREYAWREMAKQIAHEIKNPLTPMKLNVQQLYKKWKDNPENFGESLKSFKQYQIEQIDNLSSIASEFSNFARMPEASPRETDLVDHLNAVIELYNDINTIDLNVDFNGLAEVKVYADKEQLHSMLSNILRNAVQAIPGNRRGIINVGIRVKAQKAIISVEDNGVGIPPELKNKLFAPNFTTKSSGMGLGLAIVKRIVETANGRVWFESEPDRGTVFYIEYPVLSYNKNA